MRLFLTPAVTRPLSPDFVDKLEPTRVRQIEKLLKPRPRRTIDYAPFPGLGVAVVNGGFEQGRTIAINRSSDCSN